MAESLVVGDEGSPKRESMGCNLCIEGLER